MNRRWVLILLLLAANCHERTKILQRRTMANVRTVATALEAYADDAGQYPSVSTPKELVNELVPKYMARDERSDEGYTGPDGTFVDEWRRTLRYECWKEAPDAEGCDHYALASAGDDGIFDSESLREMTERPLRDANEDIVYRDGKFIRYPSAE